MERPEPKARTYDLDATVGRRTIGQRRWCGGSVVDRPEAGVRIVSLTGWRWLRCGRFGCLGISSFRWWAHDAIKATTTVGLNQFDDSPALCRGSCRSSSSPSWPCPTSCRLGLFGEAADLAVTQPVVGEREHAAGDRHAGLVLARDARRCGGSRRPGRGRRGSGRCPRSAPTATASSPSS